ncbi:hypothetical protein ABC345_20070 [Shouchella sp. 1P09AA]|uniref:hypothetical protein n=1 Tax=unclassified Shouchella TaxID=2893065 RepID=UPI0039A25615
MKSISSAIIVTFILIFTWSSISHAHPGRTDGNGGHYCRTNCEKWGLNYDEYHYHNGGSSNSSSSNSVNKSPSTPESSPAPKPSYTQADIDEGSKAGREKGYEHGYERKDKSSSTDHPNEGYRIGYEEGYGAGYEEGQNTVREEDQKDGHKQGESEGKKAARSNNLKAMENDSSKSSDWNKSYEESFKISYDKETTVVNVEEKGHSLGYALDELTFPESIENNDELIKIYKDHYNEGFEKRTQEEMDIHYELGVDNGYKLVGENSTEFDKRFESSYLDGYQEGFEKIRAETVDKGYLLAFQTMDYEQPKDVTQLELLDWYEEGFFSNTIAEEIKVSAYDHGYTNKDYYIPDEFKITADSIALYDELFFEGQGVKVKEDRNQLILVTAGISILGVAAGGGFYVKKKRKGKVKTE